MAFGTFYLWRINPQDQTRLRQIRIKNAALRRFAGQPRLLVGGDSTVAFGMDPTILKEVTGLPTINLGYDAGCGILALLGVVDRSAAAGDTVVVQFTAELLNAEPVPLREGRLLAMLYGEPAIALGGSPSLIPGGIVQGILTQLSAASPTERRMLNDGGRILLSMPGFRYQNCAIDENGYFVGKVFLPFADAGPFTAPTGKTRPILQEFTTRMHRRGVQVFYSLPWIKCRAEDMPILQQGAETLLRSVEQAMPVLREPGYGLQTDLSLYADTGAHLSVEGARRRSRSLGTVLNQQFGRADASPTGPHASP